MKTDRISGSRVQPGESEVPFCATDAAGQITYANTAFAGMSGATDVELIGVPLSTLFDAAAPAAQIAAMNSRMAAGQAWSDVVKHRAVNGEPFWTRFQSVPLKRRGHEDAHRVIALRPSDEEVQQAQRRYAAANRSGWLQLGSQPWLATRQSSWSSKRSPSAGSLAWRVHRGIGLLCGAYLLASCIGRPTGSSWEAGAMVCTLGGFATSLWLVSTIAGPLWMLQGQAAALATGEAPAATGKKGCEETERTSLLIDYASRVQRALLIDVSAQVGTLSEATSRHALHADLLSQKTEHFAAALQEVATSLEGIQSRAPHAEQRAGRLKLDLARARDARALVAESVSTCTASLGAAVNTHEQIAARMAELQDLASRAHQVVTALGIDDERDMQTRSLLQRTVTAAGEVTLLSYAALAALQQDHRSLIQAEQSAIAGIREATVLLDQASALQTRLSEQSKSLAWAQQALAFLDSAAQRNASLVEEARSAAVTLQGGADRLVIAIKAFGG